MDEDQKQLPFAEAEPGATGLELLLPLVLKWGAERKLPLATTLARVTSDAGAHPRRALGAHRSRARPRTWCCSIPTQHWRVAPEALKSQGKNTPFLGYELAGRVRTTVVAGQVVYER